MIKALVHFIVLVGLFFGTWFLLGQINFVELFDVEQLTRDNEHRLGELILDTIKKGNDKLESDSVQTFLNNIKQRLCNANSIKDSSITLHILIQDDVNAFALPDRNLVVYTGLIQYCDSAEELSGVLAHEIAHMEQHHVMKKLVKEVGLSMLRTIAGGESGGEIMRETVKLLSSTAFDREQEEEADIMAVHLMAKADIDPKYFANFLFRLSQEKDNIPKHFEWLSTHPNSQDRSAEILQLRKQEIYHHRAIADNARWARMKEYAGETRKKSKR
jgi:predicted Zn-dependent protease